MHILAFEDQPTEFAGGQERSLFEVLQALSEQGAKVSLCYRQEGNLLKAYNKFVETTFRIESRRLTRPVHSLFKDLWKLAIRAHASGWDALYVNQYFDTPVAASIGLLCRIPVICHLRLACPEYLSRQYRWGLNRCAKLIANSRYTMKTYAEAGIPTEHMTVVYNGIDTDFFCPKEIQFQNSPLSRPYRITYFGRLCPSKGVEVLIQAFKSLNNVPIPLKLHIVGNVRSHLVGPEYLNYLEELAYPDLSTSIILKPHCRDIREELAETDLVVLPTLSQESFGRVIIEAMAFKVPVIASNVGGIPEVLAPRFSDHLFPPSDPEALAETISRLISWRVNQPDLGGACRELVISKFSLAHQAGELLSVFQSI